MVLGIFKNGRRLRAAQRAIGLLLLTLTFVDIAIIDVFVPGLCEREEMMISLAQAATAVSNTNDIPQHISDANSTEHQKSSAPSPIEEDCFCCCAHILPTALYRLPVLHFPSERTASLIAFLPAAPPLKMFRPPRLA